MSATVGTRHLIRLALRRDRVILPIWIVLLGLVPAGTVAAYEELYPDAASRAALAAGAGANPSVAVLYGPAYDLSTAGGFTAWRYGLFLGLFAALMSVFTVTRHTRAEEDSGRLELLGSTVLGRYSALTASVLVAGGANLVIGLVCSLGLIGAGLPAAGAFAFGGGTAAVGLVFTAIAAVTAQLTEYARSANGIACGVIGVAFLLRAVGDSSPDARWLSWLSPLAWPQKIRPFAGEQWWVFGLAVVAAVAVGSVGYLLVPRRDIGAGMLAARPGPASAPRSLSSPLGLAWRLQRGSLIGWTIAMAVVGAVLGSIANGIGDLVGSSEQAREIFERMGGASAIVDAYLASIAGVFGLITAGYAVQATLRLRSEETTLRAEPVLAGAVSRVGWAASHLAFALVGSAVVLAGTGLATGLAHGLRTDDVATQVGNTLTGMLGQLPAVWVVAALAALLFGLAPTYSALAWGAVGLFVVMTLFGPVVGLPQWLMDVSPFTHVPKITGSLTATPLLWLTAVAVVGLAAGLTALRRRDIA